MTERDEDEFADLSGEQGETVRQARKWLQGSVLIFVGNVQQFSARLAVHRIQIIILA
jgi:hypothetical protein